MAIWRVEMSGEAREVYDVEADSEEEAKAHWSDGDLVISEVFGVEPVSAKEMD
jgi:hypothetical protein